MWRWCAFWCSMVLFGMALVALPAITIVPSYLGGSAHHGYFEDGRYFVGGHGRTAEVSESAWWLAYWVEILFPFSILVPAAAGYVLYRLQALPNQPRLRSAEVHPFLAALTGIVTVWTGAGLGWLIGRAPWTIWLGGWLGLYVGIGLLVWLIKHRARQHFIA